MNNVYLDLLFLINFFTDYIALLCTAKISHAVIRRKYIAFASLIGGTYACFCMLYQNHWLNTPLTQLSCAVLLCFISFYQENHLFRCCITFLMISAIFGGILSPFVFVTEQGMRLSINLKALLVTFVAVYCILSQLYRRAASKNIQTYQHAEIRFRNQTITLTVLKDTGNELYDPISNLPVLVIEKDLASKLIAELYEEHNGEDKYESFCRLSTIPDLMGKLRIIPCQSISGKDVLVGFIPDKLLIDGKQREMIVAYTNFRLSTSNQYQGIC